MPKPIEYELQWSAIADDAIADDAIADDAIADDAIADDAIAGSNLSVCEQSENWQSIMTHTDLDIIVQNKVASELIMPEAQWRVIVAKTAEVLFASKQKDGTDVRA